MLQPGPETRPLSRKMPYNWAFSWTILLKLHEGRSEKKPVASLVNPVKRDHSRLAQKRVPGTLFYEFLKDGDLERAGIWKWSNFSGVFLLNRKIYE
jgi:hypothetical protein